MVAGERDRRSQPSDREASTEVRRGATEKVFRRRRCVTGIECYLVHIKALETPMSSSTFTVRVDLATKRRLERLAKSTGRSRSFLAAEAIDAYLEVNEWQVAGINSAIASADRGEVIPHTRVKAWVGSWGRGRELAMHKPS